MCKCQSCDSPLPAASPAGICPAGLMTEAIGPMDSMDTLGDAPLTGDAPNDSERQTPDPLEGTTLGPGGRYKLLQRIGEGGFGTVFMAEQTSPVRRRVAIKILKAGMDTRQVVARFEAERQALAMMDHPNIAKVLDGGETGQGRPFFVMELVRGTPITSFCDREKLDTTARLHLFLQVCRAVQHAHQKGIIHRDLKPGNILVTVQEGAQPVPKVIDFGVAKAMEANLTDKTLFTRFEQMIGTPAYMSPEQAGTDADATDIDTRADIYALGVLLYELLTGSTPFESETLHHAAFDEIRRILREEEAPRPSARLSSLELDRRTTIANCRSIESANLSKQLRGDLDWIVMKAIEKDRRRRYETANAFAADLERHLEDKPVSAGPPTAAYRTTKFLRRHKAPIAVAGVMVFMLMAGIAASAWQAVRATAEGRRAIAEKERAMEAEALAEQRRAEAEAISNFLTGMFESAKPGAKDGWRTITVENSLKIAEKKLEEDEEIPPLRRAILQRAIGNVYNGLGRRDDALALRERVRQFYDETLGPDHPDTLAAMRDLASSYNDVDRWDEAQAMREEVLNRSRKILGLEHPDTLCAMNDLANSYGNDDRPYNDPDRWGDALAMREEVLKIRRKVLGLEHPDTLRTIVNLSRSYFTVGRRDEGIEMCEEALVQFRKVRGPDHPDTLAAMQVLANFYYDLGRWDEALAMREEELKLRRKVLGSEHPNILEAMYHLSVSYGQAERREDQLMIREEMLALSRKILGPEHYQTLDAMRHVASTYAAVGRSDEAFKLREEVLALDRKVLGPKHSSTLRAMDDLASSYEDAGRRDEALAMREEELELWRKGSGAEHRDTINAMCILAISYAEAGRKDKSIAMGEEVLALFRKVRGPEHPDTLWAMGNLANSYGDAGRRDEALAMREEVLAMREEVLAMREKALGAEHPDTLNSMNELAVSYHNMADLVVSDKTAGRQEKALAMFEQVLALREKVLGLEHPDTLRSMRNLAVAYHEAGRHEEALVLEGGGHRLLKPDSPSAAATLVPPASEWRWLHSIDGIDPAEADPDFHRSFFHVDYDDTAWQIGSDSEDLTGGFGYGDEGFTGVAIGTPAEKPLGKSAYLRHRFSTADEFTHLELRCHRDDGIIVYLDGVEVVRDNMSAGEDAYLLPAQRTVSAAAETAVFRFPLDGFTLAPGEHVLAISLHNTERPSSDLRIGAISLVEME